MCRHQESTQVFTSLLHILPHALPQWKFPNSHSTVQEIRPKYQLVSKTERDHYRKHYLQPEMWVMCGRAIKLFCDLVSIDSTHVLQGYCTGTTENKPFIIMFWATPAVGVESCLKFRGYLFETTLQLMMQQFAYNWYLPLYTNTHTQTESLSDCWILHWHLYVCLCVEQRWWCLFWAGVYIRNRSQGNCL